MASTAGSGRSAALLGGLFAAALLKTACEGGKPGAAGDIDASIAAVLGDLGPQVLRPSLDRAAAAAQALHSATLAWQSAEASDAAGEVEQLAAQEAWADAMAAWQELEQLQLGPAASSLSAVAGEDRRDAIYSWPTVNRCRVDQETVYGGYAEEDFFQTALVNTTGLDALEVLLYSPPGQNDCPSQVDINAEGSWEALGADALQQRRADYAAVLSAELLRQVGLLQQAWDPAGGDFGAQLAAAGEAGSPYASSQEGLNAIFDALFYLELMLKDRKLGYALGLGACEDDSCVEDIESPVAGLSHRWVPINLGTARQLYLGGEGAGLDDLLVVIGQEGLHDEVLAAFDAAEAAAAIPLPYDQADPDQLLAAYDAVKALTDLLKGEVATALSLQVPAEAAGDND